MQPLPSRARLACEGLRSAVADLAAAEERAHACLDRMAGLVPSAEAVAAVERGLTGLDAVDVALPALRQALRDLDRLVARLDGDGKDGKGGAETVDLGSRLLDRATHPGAWVMNR